MQFFHASLVSRIWTLSVSAVCWLRPGLLSFSLGLNSDLHVALSRKPGASLSNKCWYVGHSGQLDFWSLDLLQPDKKKVQLYREILGFRAGPTWKVSDFSLRFYLFNNRISIKLNLKFLWLVKEDNSSQLIKMVFFSVQESASDVWFKEEKLQLWPDAKHWYLYFFIFFNPGHHTNRLCENRPWKILTVDRWHSQEVLQLDCRTMVRN